MKEEKAKIIVCVLIIACISGLWTLVTAGDLEPSASPAPTMKTLDEIYDAAASVSQREGYIGHFNVSGGSNAVCLTVPAGKQFVLLKIIFRYDSTAKRQAYLTVDDDFLTGYPYLRSYMDNYNYIQSFADFPDRCVTVDAEGVLKVVNDESGTLNAMVVGYYYDVP